MTPSNRRLATTTSKRRQYVDIPALSEAFLSYHNGIGSSHDTVRHYRHSLDLFLRCLEESTIEPVAASLTSATFNTFAAWLRSTPTRKWRGKSERSIWGIHGALKDCKIWVRWLTNEEYIAKAPKVPVPKLPQRLFPILTEDDLERIFACKHLTGNTEVVIRNRALVAFMLDTGVRLAEVAGITLVDLDLKGNGCLIRGKGNKERMVYFSEGVTESLRRWLAIRGDDDGTLFWLKAAGIRMLLDRIKTETGLSVFTAHQIRHTAFTMLVKQNVDLHTIKRIAGHASVTTTEAYLALAGEDIRAKVASASPFDRIRERTAPVSPGRRRLKVS